MDVAAHMSIVLIVALIIMVCLARFATESAQQGFVLEVKFDALLAGFSLGCGQTGKL